MSYTPSFLFGGFYEADFMDKNSRQSPIIVDDDEVEYTKEGSTMKKFSMIAAISLNGVIGDSISNSIPWHIPSDFKHFKEYTTGKTIVMGSNTYRSIGKPLPKRRNVVITRDSTAALEFLLNGVDKVYASFTDAYNGEEEGFVVIGGERIYAEALTLQPEILEITVVDLSYDGKGAVKFPFTGQHVLDDSVPGYIIEKQSTEHNENSFSFCFFTLKHTS